MLWWQRVMYIVTYHLYSRWSNFREVWWLTGRREFRRINASAVSNEIRQQRANAFVLKLRTNYEQDLDFFIACYRQALEADRRETPEQFINRQPRKYAMLARRRAQLFAIDKLLGKEYFEGGSRPVVRLTDIGQAMAYNFCILDSQMYERLKPTFQSWY